jgi:hypothetical protein
VIKAGCRLSFFFSFSFLFLIFTETAHPLEGDAGLRACLGSRVGSVLHDLGLCDRHISTANLPAQRSSF